MFFFLGRTHARTLRSLPACRIHLYKSILTHVIDETHTTEVKGERNVAEGAPQFSPEGWPGTITYGLCNDCEKAPPGGFHDVVVDPIDSTEKR